MQAVLKAGGIGAVILIVLNLLGLIPCVGCITLLLSLVVYVGIGVLAAQWMAPPRTTGSGAGAGAAAAVVAALIAGIVNLVVTGIYYSVTGVSQLSQIPPEQIEALYELGIDPALLVGPAAIIGVGAVCCTIFLFIAAGLGAAGGAFWGSSHPS
jgi:hypothetical protein